MDAMKLKILQEILSHLDNSQGDDLKKSLMGPEMEDPMEKEMPMDDAMEPGDPKDMPMDKGEVMGKPSFNQKADEAIAEMSGKPKPPAMDDEEMSDEELKEMLAQLLKG